MYSDGPFPLISISWVLFDPYLCFSRKFYREIIFSTTTRASTEKRFAIISLNCMFTNISSKIIVFIKFSHFILIWLHLTSNFNRTSMISDGRQAWKLSTKEETTRNSSKSKRHFPKNVYFVVTHARRSFSGN